MRIKFFVFFIIVLSTISGLFFVALQNIESTITHEKREMFANIADSVSDKIDSFFHNRIVDLISLAEQDEIIQEIGNIQTVRKSETIEKEEYKEEYEKTQTLSGIIIYPGLQHDLEKYMRINQDFISIEILDANGKVLVYSELERTADNKIALKPFNIKKLGIYKTDRSWFRDAKNLIGENTYVLEDAHVSSNDKRITLDLAIPIKNHDGTFIGAIMGRIDMQEIWDMTDTIHLGKSGEIMLYNKEGYQIADPDKTKLFTKPYERVGFDIPSLKELLKGKAGTTIETSEMGELSITAYKTLPGQGFYRGLGWGMQVTEDVSEALAYILLLKRGAYILIAIAVIFFILLYIWLEIDLFAPLISMQRGYERIAQGDMNTTLEYKMKTNSEIGSLFYFFNKMVQQLKKNTDFLEQYKKAIDVSSMVFRTDTSGNITYFNDKFITVSLFEKENTKNFNAFNLFHTDFSPVSIRDIGYSLEEKTIWSGEIKYRKGDGGYYWTVTTIIPIYNEEAKDYYYIWLNHDITKEKDLEEQLQNYGLSEIEAREKIIRELRQISQTKDDFINIASHELRTPMTVVKGYISMILDGDAGDINNEVRQYLRKVFDGASGLLLLINDMLDIAKLESGKMEIIEEPVDVQKLITEICLDMGQVSKVKSQELDMKVDYENIVAMIDAGKFRQVFVNLIGNALKFTPENGNIRIHSFIEDSSIITTITDTGVGIEQENLEKIFDKFIQVKNNATKNVTGTGLGLPIVKMIIGKMNGTISVESTIGRGSVFTVKIPLKKEGV